MRTRSDHSLVVAGESHGHEAHGNRAGLGCFFSGSASSSSSAGWNAEIYIGRGLLEGRRHRGMRGRVYLSWPLCVRWAIGGELLGERSLISRFKVSCCGLVSRSLRNT